MRRRIIAAVAGAVVLAVIAAVTAATTRPGRVVNIPDISTPAPPAASASHPATSAPG